MVIYK